MRKQTVLYVSTLQISSKDILEQSGPEIYRKEINAYM